MTPPLTNDAPTGSRPSDAGGSDAAQPDPGRRLAFAALALAVLAGPLQACAAPARRRRRRRTGRRVVRRRARIVTRSGRRALVVASLPAAGEVLELGDGREAVVQRVEGDAVTIEVSGDVETLIVEVE